MKSVYGKIICVLLLLSLLAMPKAVFATESVASGSEQTPAITMAELEESRSMIGVSSYSGEDLLVGKLYPKALIVYFDDNIAAYNAVRMGKVDAFFYSKEELKKVIDDGFPGVCLLDETVENNGEEIAVMVAIEGAEGYFADRFTLVERFRETFLKKENRDIMVRGVITTAVLMLMSIIGGTMLGFALFLSGRRGNPVVLFLANIITQLLGCMPVIVLLLIFYYIVFPGSRMSGSVVSIITFSLTFGAAVYDILCTSIGTVNQAQVEAAFSMGYTERRSFYRILLPQVIQPFMPLYRGAVTELVKASSVVGFIAVSDLTNVGTIVQNRTYEAVLPLLVVAVIYLLMIWLLRTLLLFIENRINPRRRDRALILKGVKVHD